MLTFFTFILVLSVLVLVHEAGHFFAARRFGIRVEEFGLGFPPKIAGKRIGKTLFTLNLIPFGGFVRLYGENGQEKNDPESFAAQPMLKRAVVLAAGVIMNLVLAFVVFSAGFSFGLPAALDNVPAGGRIRDQQLSVAEVSVDSPAAQAGLQRGDAVLAVGGRRPATIEDLHTAASTAQATTFTIEREKKEIELTATPTASADGTLRFGVQVVPVGVVSYPIHLAVVQGASLTVRAVGQIVTSLGDFAGDLVRHQKISQDVSGPVGIAVLTGQVVALGWPYLFQFVALLSLSLAVMNVLPIPALDGGRLAFLVIERFRRKPIDQRTEQLVHAFGFYILLALILVISVRDVQRFAIFDSLRSAWQSIFS
jgi:regulator of sigma E protease